MFANLFQSGFSLDGAWSQDWFTCTDRDKKTPNKLSAIPAPFFRKEQEQGKQIKQVGTPLDISDDEEEETALAIPHAPLPSYYDTMILSNQQDMDDDSISASSDEEFEKDFSEAGKTMFNVLRAQRKGIHDRPEWNIESRIDGTLRDLEHLAEMQGDSHGSSRPHRRVRREHHVPKKSNAPATASPGKRVVADLAREATDPEDVREAAKLRSMKEQISQERRVWGQVPDRSVLDKEIKHYQDTMRLRYEKMGAQGKADPFRSDTANISEVVRDGVLAYHKQCQKMGKWHVFSRDDSDHGVHDLSLEERQKLGEHIKNLRTDVREDVWDDATSTSTPSRRTKKTAPFPGQEGRTRVR